MILNDIIKWRRYIHQNPEIGYDTFKTAKYIYEILVNLGYKCQYVLNKAGVVARLELNKNKTIAFRSDIDALKIVEKTSFSYKSTNEYMHACGHDAHAAMLLGAAKMLIEAKNSLNCNLVLIFQPAEEGPLPGGALPLINEYDLSDVDMFFAFHVTNKLAANTVGIKIHEATAAPDLWECKITGKGCHASMPKNGNNPLIPASVIINELDKLYKSFNDPFKVISTTYVSGGTSMNIIPDDITIKGTARTVKNEERKLLEESMSSLINKIANEYGVVSEFIYHYAYDPVYNDDFSSQLAFSAAKNIMGEDKVILLDSPEMVGEDFSYYRRVAPICLMWLGVRGEKQEFYDLHSSSFTLEENSLITGSRLFYQIALNFNKK